MPPARALLWDERIQAAILQVEAGFVHGRWSEVSARALLWNFTGALVLRLSAMVLIPSVVCVFAGAWTGVYGADGQFVQLGHFRAALLALALTRASTYLIKPVRAWLKALHDSVRDDRYLVGMRLQDHADNAPIAAGPGSANLNINANNNVEGFER